MSVSPMPSLQQVGRRRRSQGAVALARARLRGSRRARAARIGAWIVTAGFAGMAVVLRLTDGAEASLAGVVVGATQLSAWLSGAPLTLAAAEDHAGLDRREGILSLAAARGVSPAGLTSARTMAAMMEIAATIGLPVFLLALLTAGLAGRASEAVHRIALGVSALGFAVVAGVTLGVLGTVCGRIGRARGRWLLVAVVLVPWMFAELAGHSAWSIPGALGAVLDFALGRRGAGA
ncbi:Hypothetical protein A7982_06009 [Minicystis rosea]|nr:Hypothetical protein A7982_06009 [Minicystis rosea]